MDHDKETELKESEQRYWHAIQDRDIPTIAKLAEDPCVLAGAQGVRTVSTERLLRQG